MGGDLRGELVAQQLVLFVAQVGGEGHGASGVLGVGVDADALGAVEA